MSLPGATGRFLGSLDEKLLDLRSFPEKLFSVTPLPTKKNWDSNSPTCANRKKPPPADEDMSRIPRAMNTTMQLYSSINL